MDKLKATGILILCFSISFFSFLIRNEDKQHHNNNVEVQEIKRNILLERIKTILSLPTTFSPSSSYGNKVKTLFNQVQTHLFSPNLDFRGRNEAESVEGGGGMGEKVKEAVGKGFQRSKATMEGTAESAANKVKETLSHGREPYTPQEEL